MKASGGLLNSLTDTVVLMETAQCLEAAQKSFNCRSIVEDKSNTVAGGHSQAAVAQL